MCLRCLEPPVLISLVQVVVVVVVVVVTVVSRIHCKSINIV